MTSDRPDAALDEPDPPDRTPSVPVEVAIGNLDALLREDAELETWINIAAEAVGPPPPLGSFGPYRLIEELGRGGQGIVFRAVQPGTNREVAIKRLGPGMLFGSRDRERFGREVQALTRLAHPGIVTVYAAEIIESHPLLVMELVEGRPIDRWADGCDGREEEHARQDVRTVLDAFVRVCDAVAHAHQRGVIHRDIKPSNVLIDTTGAPRVVDFGIARLLDDMGPRGTVTTMTGFVGTPAYASPEQLDGRTADVDARSDVYALGILLHRLLTGIEPFDGEGGLRTMIERINRGPSRLPSQIRPGLARDIDWVVLRAIDADPRRRYATVDALAQDVRRFLAGDAVSAHPPSRLYLATKFIRRHAAGVAALTIVLLALVMGMIVSTTSLVRERNARLAEAGARAEAEIRHYIAEIRAAASALQTGDMGGARGALAGAPSHLRGWEWHHLLGAADDADAVIFEHGGRPNFVFFHANGDWIALGDVDTRKLILAERADGVAQPIAQVDDYSGVIHALWPDDGLMMDTVCIRQVADGELHTRISLIRGDILGVRTESGRFAIFTNDRRLRVCDWSEVTDQVERAAREGVIVDSDTLAWLVEGPAPANLSNMTAAMHGDRIAIGTTDGLVSLHDAEGATTVNSAWVTDGYATALDFSPDGTRLAVGSTSPTITILRVPDLDVLTVLEGHAEVISGLSFLPDGRHLLSASWDGTLRVWDLQDGRSVRTLRGHVGGVRWLALVDEGMTALTLGDEGSVRQWSVDPAHLDEEPGVLRGFSRLIAFALTPDAPADGWMVVLNAARSVEEGARALAVNMRNPDDRRPLDDKTTSRGDARRTRWGVDISRDGRLAAVDDGEGRLEIFDLESLHDDATLPQTPTLVLAMTDRPLTRHDLGRVNAGSGVPRDDPWVDRVRFSPDDAMLAASAGRDVEVFSLSNGRSIARTRIDSATTHIDFSPDGDALVLAASHGTLSIWRFATQSSPRLVREGLGPLTDVEWSSDGRTIAVSFVDGTARLYRAHDLEQTHILRGHVAACRSVSFSPDGTRLVTASDDRTVRVWHVRFGLELLALRGHDLFISEAQFSRDGQWIVSVAPDNTVRYWGAHRGRRLQPSCPPMPH